ncbi:MAG: hypothetical protein NTY74_14655 [Ignavibacteriae bacterium]|nr:hypothetical protein [Ignavibacteriota bacterium]
MNNHFKSLLSNKLQNQYCDFISENSSLKENIKTEFLNIIQNKSNESLKSVENKLKSLRFYLGSISDIHKLANPYYIGFGNPDADILFLGKEKGFDVIEHPELFIKESINNVLQWEYILNDNENTDHKLIYDQLGFNPMFPRIHDYGILKKNHTWYYYSKIVAGLKNKNADIIFDETKVYNNSLFSDCFISEVNYVPSKYSNGLKLIDKRKKLLQNMFYKKFKKIIIGAKSYLKDDEIMEIFNLKDKGKEVQVGKYGKNKSKNYVITKFNNHGQTIIKCNQLSGASGWTDEAISSIIDVLKK